MTVLRIYDEARTTHLERLQLMQAGRFLFRKTRYDFDEDLANEIGAERRSRLMMSFAILRDRPRYIEINEPFYVAAWPTLALLTISIWTARVLFRRRITVSCYCIENVDPVAVFKSKSRLGYELSARLIRPFLRFILWPIDRIVFGSIGARTNYYRGIPDLGNRVPDTTLKPAVSAPCASCDLARSLKPESQFQLCFVGAFEPHKGITQLMGCWDEVAAAVPRARLVMLGMGSMEQSVLAWADERSENVFVTTHPSRSLIHHTLAESKCLVLLSQRAPRWREQIGLPILEGLSHGCEIVASSETGIADWLYDNGHVVVPADSGLTLIARDISRALLSDDRSRSDILATLPAHDTRLAADDWMFRENSDPATDVIDPVVHSHASEPPRDTKDPDGIG